jgi:hypothetical protein
VKRWLIGFLAIALLAIANINGPYDGQQMTTVGPQTFTAFGQPASYYVGLSSIGGPQTATISIYDSNLLCSGTLIFQGIPGNSQEIEKLWPGRRVINGVTACASGAIVGAIEIYVR